jgi:hypothetical protein
MRPLHTTLTCLLFIISISSVFSQNEKGLGLEVVFNPNYDNIYITGSKEARKAIKLDGLFAFDAGAQIKVFSTGKFSVRSGLLYSKKGINWGEFNFTDSNNDPAGTAKVVDILHFLVIPLKARYTLSEQHPFYLQLGINNDILLKHTPKTTYHGNPPATIESTLDPRNYNAGLDLAIGYTFSINKFQFSVEPNLKYQMMGVTKQKGTIAQHLYNIGVSLSARVF